ncbi:hypothetical protein A1O3_03786 [Capronia epimyces CBS 606.96]|uniref:Uncharacterized protein n=1 Tax=Capronia epimyces CBS 606.96 TaxID=1182542 RepID=W9Y231_9EURO|nr:uncharacterized protein A1O3_03786 [Capronia epimyces CBS 606.96]EXJ86832.1 hypothetical protein A1O3_03786 [Capronia epimyces CBS 606.96]
MILSGACAAFTLVCILSFLFLHGIHLSRPSEQIKIMRIGLLLPLYACISFLSICFPNAYVYIMPWIDVYQAIALATFFLLMNDLVWPTSDRRDMHLSSMAVPQKGRKAANGPLPGHTWYKRRYLAVFQYMPVALVAAVAACITQAAKVYCLESSKPYFAHFWLDLIKSFAVTVSVLSNINFYKVFVAHLKAHKAMSKLLAFKLPVFFTFVLQIVWWGLRSQNVLKPNSKLTYADLYLGIQSLIICVLMVPLSVFFWYAYSIQPYRIRHTTKSVSDGDGDGDGVWEPTQEYHPLRPLSYQGGFLGIRAWLAMLNPSDIIQAFGFCFDLISNKEGR